MCIGQKISVSDKKKGNYTYSLKIYADMPLTIHYTQTTSACKAVDKIYSYICIFCIFFSLPIYTVKTSPNPPRHLHKCDSTPPALSECLGDWRTLLKRTQSTKHPQTSRYFWFGAPFQNISSANVSNNSDEAGIACDWYGFVTALRPYLHCSQHGQTHLAQTE